MFKTLHKSTLVVVAILTFLVLSCKSDDGPGEEGEPTRIEILTTSPWLVESVVVDDIDQTSLFTDFEISFTTETYTTTNGSNAWAPSGTWQFKNVDQDVMVRGDGVEVTIVSLNTERLVMRFFIDSGSLGPGRSKGVAGEHTFTCLRLI